MKLIVSAKPLWTDGTEGGEGEYAGKELVLEDGERTTPKAVGHWLIGWADKWIGTEDHDVSFAAPPVKCDAVDVTISKREDGTPSEPPALVFEVFEVELPRRPREWYFHAKARNDEIVIQSQSYASKQAAYDTIELIVGAAHLAPVRDIR